MKRLASILIVAGYLSVVLGFGSVGYGLLTGNLGSSPEVIAARSGRGDPDGDSRVFVIIERFFLFVAGGVVAVGIGGFVRGRCQPDKTLHTRGGRD